jgi:hypothetical protein
MVPQYIKAVACGRGRPFILWLNNKEIERKEGIR